MDRRQAVEHDARSGPQLLPRMHQRLPAIAFDRRDEQALDGAAARHAPAEQPRRDHARVVHDEKIAWRQELRERSHRRVDDRARRAIEAQEPRGGPFGGRLLCDEI